MQFQSSLDEIILVDRIDQHRKYLIDKNLNAGMTILWNTGPKAVYTLYNQDIEIETNCISFLTEFHKVENIDATKTNVIQFNRAFYCVEENDHETGCKGILFYNATSIPKLVIPKDKLRQFNALWEVFNFEMEDTDELTIDMLRLLLKRFIILSLRVYKKQSQDIPADASSIAIIREFNYLVSIHYKEITQVKEYAQLLNKSPKTLSNIFKSFIDKTPLQIINEHRLREARHQLKYYNRSILEISDDLNFNDVQAFSNFFKKRESISPSQFRVRVCSSNHI